MKRKINPLVIIYLLFVFVPIALVATILTAIATIILAFAFGDKKVAYYPAIWWSKLLCAVALVKVKIEGSENFDHHKSYIFVANHQSIFDIFIIYGWLDSRFKWIMKKEIRKIPFVGSACNAAGHIFIDRSSAAKALKSIEEAEKKLKGGSSVVIFPEGTRTNTGKMGKFKKGAFGMAVDLDLDIVPITIKGAYNVLPKHKIYIKPGTIEMKIHRPISTDGITYANLPEFMDKVHQIIEQDLQ